MSNEPKPLLSDGDVKRIVDKWIALDHTEPYPSLMVRDLYEAERTKLMAVLQVCADALAYQTKLTTELNDEGMHIECDFLGDALSQLKSIGVEPNK